MNGWLGKRNKESCLALYCGHSHTIYLKLYVTTSVEDFWEQWLGDLYFPPNYNSQSGLIGKPSSQEIWGIVVL